MFVLPTNLHQLHNVIKSIWTKISEKCFQHLVLKAKGGLTRYLQGVTNKVAGVCV